MGIKRSNWLLIHEKLSSFFPDSSSFNGLVESIFGDFDVEMVGEGIDLFIEESNIVFGIFSGQINVLQHFFGIDAHSNTIF